MSSTFTPQIASKFIPVTVDVDLIEDLWLANPDVSGKMKDRYSRTLQHVLGTNVRDFDLKSCPRPPKIQFRSQRFDRNRVVDSWIASLECPKLHYRKESVLWIKNHAFRLKQPFLSNYKTLTSKYSD